MNFIVRVVAILVPIIVTPLSRAATSPFGTPQGAMLGNCVA